MNWKAISGYGACLSITQISLGVAAGFFDASSQLSVWDFLSFVIATALFTLLTIRNKDRPLLHAVLSLAFYGVISLAFAALISGFLGKASPLLTGLEWLGLIISMAIGVIIGKVFGPRQGEPREA